MLDRPTAEELLQAVYTHLEAHIIPIIKADRKLYFQTLVAINVLRIVEREFGNHQALKEEWESLHTLLDDGAPAIPENHHDFLTQLKARNNALADAIRSGDIAISQPILAYLMQTTMAQLQVSNPLFLYKLLKEVNDPTLDAWASR